MYSQSTPFSFHSDSELYFTQGDNRIGGKYWKARYTEYVDATFTRRKRFSEAEAHLGILGTVKYLSHLERGRCFSGTCNLIGSDSSAPIHFSVSFHLFSLLFQHFSGPVIKAEVGDTLLVTFANKADKVYSILPHGVIYDKASDAAPNVDGKS